MKKYLELTAPDETAFRHAKIISIEVQEGTEVTQGEPLFMVENNGNTLPLPAQLNGKITEIIVSEGEQIGLATPLLLLETIVEEKSEKEPPEQVKKKGSEKKNHPASKQQSLLDDLPEQTEDMNQATAQRIIAEIPDIGGDSAKVVEILVKVGDTIEQETPLITLESDKASMEVPSPVAGTVTAILLELEQEVEQGTAILEVSNIDATTDDATTDAQATPPATTPTSENTGTTHDVRIPDIGGDSARVIEILTKVGDQVKKDDPLITLESDKASMDVPSDAAGEVVAIHAQLEQEMSEGDILVSLKLSDSISTPASSQEIKPQSAQQAVQQPEQPVLPNNNPVNASVAGASQSHASPSVRRFARELGANLNDISGTGRKNRITRDDVKAHIKQRLSGGTSASPGNTGIPAIPAVDFAKFGEIETQPLNKIKKLTAANLHRSWLNVPHVTHNDEANTSDLEAFRKQLNQEYAAQENPIKLSPLAFIVKAVVNALQTYPQFNSSLEPGGENLIIKKYYHIGIAVDTPNGLVVPVLRDADTKSVAKIAREMGELAEKARNKKLTPADMSGACFTISSLGGIGGTGFTPIVNAPEVAILGISRSKLAPHWNGQEFVPVSMLPLSLSYDHRVIDGAEAARFTRHIATALEDVRRLSV